MRNAEKNSMADYTIVFRSQDGNVKRREVDTSLLYHDFISEQVSTLVERGLIRVGEYYKSRITPRYDDRPQFGREIVYIETPERTWLEEDKRPGWLSQQQRDGTPMRYFTMTLCTSPRGFVYKKDFSLSTLDDAVAKRLRGLDGNPGSLQQMWQWEIVAKEEDADPLPALSPDQQSLSLVILLRPPETALDDNLAGELLPITVESITDSDESTLSQESLDISLESIEDELPTRPPVTGTRQVEGIKITDEPDILILRRTLEGIIQESRNHFKGELTVGGLLVGEAFKEETTGTLVTYITNYILASRELGFHTSTSWFNVEAWDAMLRIKAERYPEKRILGWFRDHLVGTWLSPDDSLLQKHFFREPWHVVLIIDRTRGTKCFYQWKGDDGIVPNSAFQIIN